LNAMCESPDAGTPVEVIVSVPGPTMGRLWLSVKWPSTSRPPPVFTQIVSSVKPAATERTIWLSDEDVTVMPGAGVPSQPWPTSHFPSIVGHVCAPAVAASTVEAASATTATAKNRFISLLLSPFSGVDPKR
jgi:hypothetical protein